MPKPSPVNQPDPLTLLRRRRAFLRFLAASPLLAAAPSLGTVSALLAQEPGQDFSRELDPHLAQNLAATDPLITDPADALDVFDLQRVAQAKIPPAHYGYLATAVNGDATLRANREGFRHYRLRMRRLVDISRIDTSITLLGQRHPTPIILSPVSSLKAFHPEGEVAAARAARGTGNLQILSTLTTSPIEQVNEALGEPVWFQLYPTPVYSITEGLIRRAEASGSKVLVLTVDLQGGSNRESLARWSRRDTRDCSQCHGEPGDWVTAVRRRSMFSGLDVSGLATAPSLSSVPGMTWDFIRRLRDTTQMLIVIKGIVTGEDAALCVQHGVDALIVSNHGGRAGDSDRSTIESLSEIVSAVSGRLPVLIDSGFRRGTDIFKALALGASGVCIGRPYAWGLGAFGEPGVRKVLELLQAELVMTMKQAGAVSIDRITPAHILSA